MAARQLPHAGLQPVPVEQVDTTPVPKKTKWTADSYKGPFSCRLWVKVGAAGRVEKMIPIQVSDPVLIPYMRRTVSAWSIRPSNPRKFPTRRRRRWRGSKGASPS